MDSIANKSVSYAVKCVNDDLWHLVWIYRPHRPQLYDQLETPFFFSNESQIATVERDLFDAVVKYKMVYVVAFYVEIIHFFETFRIEPSRNGINPRIIHGNVCVLQAWSRSDKSEDITVACLPWEIFTVPGLQ